MKSLSRRPAKARRAPKITETQEQLVIVAYINKVGFIDDRVEWTHIRGERVGAAQRIKAKKMGVRPKFPDLLFSGYMNRGWIEMKDRGWNLRRAKYGSYTEHEIGQLALHERLRTNGEWVVICETLDDVIATLDARGIPLRAASRATEAIRNGLIAAMSTDEAVE